MSAAPITSMRAVRAAGVAETYAGLHSLRDNLTRALDRVSDGLARFPKPGAADGE